MRRCRTVPPARISRNGTRHAATDSRLIAGQVAAHLTVTAQVAMPAPIALEDSKACKPATPEAADDSSLKRLAVDGRLLRVVADGKPVVVVPRDANARFRSFVLHIK